MCSPHPQHSSHDMLHAQSHNLSHAYTHASAPCMLFDIAGVMGLALTRVRGHRPLWTLGVTPACLCCSDKSALHMHCDRRPLRSKHISTMHVVDIAGVLGLAPTRVRGHRPLWTLGVTPACLCCGDKSALHMHYNRRAVRCRTHRRHAGC